MSACRRCFGIVFVLSFLVLWAGCGSDRGLDVVAPTSNFENIDAPTPQYVIPTGYYDTADPTTSATLRTTLHAIIDDHTRFPYSSSSTDTWDILEQADQDPGNPSNILDLYHNASYPKAGGGNTNYNREHTWAKSYGFPNDGSTNYPYTDCHHLFLCDSGYNSSRSNKPFRNGNASMTEKPTLLTNGVGGGSGVYPGNSNWTSGSFTSGTWEVWQDRRGDVARALFYMDVRYEGGTHSITGASEPDLILTDNETLIANSNTGSNLSVAYMGMLSVLLQWAAEDPVDDKERQHNDVVYSYQGNRNPFVDHPEWIACVFQNTCSGGGGGDTTPPAAPTGLIATGGDGSVDLDWADNGEADLDGYNVYRSTSAGGPFSQINGALVSSSLYTDTGLSNGTTYYYQVTALDTSANESGASSTANATPAGGGGGTPGIAWINEFHYDNSSTDTGEFVEIAGTAGTSLAGWSVVGYNGNGGGSYKTVNLSGTIADQSSGFGTLGFAFSSMQNGAPDGLALVDDAGSVVEFLSYEGSFTATNGPASGMTSTDVGVSESSSTPVGSSLQRTGSGSAGSDFSWTGPLANSQGSVNAGQSFTGGPPADTTPPAAPTALIATAGAGVVDLDWADNGESDLAGYTVMRATASGGPYTALNASLLTTSLYADTSVSNGTTYYYVVTADDLTGNTSANSAEVNATPQDATPPAAPAALAATAGDGVVDLDWADNGESDLAGYTVLRATVSGGPYTALNASLLTTSLYADTSVSNGTTYYYVVTADDLTGNTSANSAEVNATPQDTTPPAAPAALAATAGDGVVDLDWADNGESDLAGYTVLRATASGGPYTALNASLLSASLYADTSVSNGTTYYYVVTADDLTGNTSANSAEVSATPSAAPPMAVLPWINEFHYDNKGGDRSEFVEVAAPAGTNLSGWSLVGYNGNGGGSYKTVTLSGTVANQNAGYGTLGFTFSKLQNGSPDGIALVDDTGAVVEFLSYEGSFTATNGPAAGMSSTDIGVSESSSTPKGQSLQRVGVGLSGGDFTWQSPSASSRGGVNAGQAFASPGASLSLRNLRGVRVQGR